MKPKKTKEQTPDLSPDEMKEGDIGGSSSEIEDEDSPGPLTTEGDEGGGGYGRPREQGDDDQPA